MEVRVNEVIFEGNSLCDQINELPEEVPEEHRKILSEFLGSGYYCKNGLCIDKFLDEDKTIHLEKLELAIFLLIEYLEFSDKSEGPIYLFLRDVDKYLSLRGISSEDKARILEETTFILGFCKAAADEFTVKRSVTVLYEPLDT